MHTFHVVEKLNHSVLFGIDFLQTTESQIDLQNNCVSLNNGLTVLPLQTFDKSICLTQLAIKWLFSFPPHPMYASALPRDSRSSEICVKI